MCDNLTRFVGPDRRRLDEDPLVLGAAERWVEIIGEAARTLSPELKRRHPEVRWQDAIGMRTILAHGYFHIDTEILWEVVSGDVPTLRKQVQAILDVLDQD
jgi:uncharacterized protein with HEPN domain